VQLQQWKRGIMQTCASLASWNTVLKKGCPLAIAATQVRSKTKGKISFESRRGALGLYVAQGLRGGAGGSGVGEDAAANAAAARAQLACAGALTVLKMILLNRF